MVIARAFDHVVATTGADRLARRAPKDKVVGAVAAHVFQRRSHRAEGLAPVVDVAEFGHPIGLEDRREHT
jgi:hypothetical protein